MASFLTSPVFCALILTLSVAMASPIPPKGRDISPEDEAIQIVLDATNTLLADEKLVEKVKKDVKLIRSENPKVAKVLNNGRKALGKAEIERFTPADLEKINKSEFGPATASPSADAKNNATVISFSKKYNPDVLSSELEKIGVHAEPIWLSGPDYGHIEYNVNSNETNYEFREGFDNCKPNCNDNHFWTFKIVDGKSVLIGEHATDIPEERVRQ